MGIKQKGKVQKPCINCFAPQYLKFNFSYIVYEDDFVEKHQIQFLKRIRELSADTYNIIRNRDKKVGLEFIEINELGIKKEIPFNFAQRFDSKDYNNKLSIMRIYTNNNPIVARVIGVIIKNVYYIFYIDIGGKLYSHD
jgi:hypothetical protein|nr:MAG TPA: hypothetical protein [Caudoviricetes sp.]